MQKPYPCRWNLVKGVRKNAWDRNSSKSVKGADPRIGTIEAIFKFYDQRTKAGKQWRSVNGLLNGTGRFRPSDNARCYSGNSKYGSPLRSSIKKSQNCPC